MVSIDFTKKWEMSDVALKMRDSDELLYVNRNILAAYSPFFKTLLLGDYAESKLDVVNLDGIDYWPMLEILKILHNVDRRFDVPIPLYSPDNFTQLWKTADGYDFPLIRQLCKQQLSNLHLTEALETAIMCEFHDEKSEILQKMTAKDLQRFFRKRDKELVFSQADAAVIFYKSRKQEVIFDLDLEDEQMSCSRHRKWSTLSDNEPPLVSIDFTNKWEMSDIVLEMKNGEELFANKAILAVHSPTFKTWFFEDSEKAKQGAAELKNIESLPMRQILGIIHHVDRRFDEATPHFSINDLVQFLKIANNYDIHLIQKLCIQRIFQMPIADGLRIAIKWGLHLEKSKILKKASFAATQEYRAKAIAELDTSAIFGIAISEIIEEIGEGLVAHAVQALKKTELTDRCPCCKNDGFYTNGSFFCQKCHPYYMPLQN